MSVYVLAGNPNCGKTTLFNRLTGSRYKVGNRAGVTVDVKEGTWNGHTVVDLPGIYSLSASNAEEKAAEEYLRSGKPDAIINIADASNPKRSLMLTEQLARMGLPMILVFNMADKLAESGFEIDTEAAKKLTGIPIVMISASKGTGTEELCRIEPRAARSFSARRVAEKCIKKKGRNQPLERSIRADKILVGSRMSGLIFATVAALIFYLTFGSVGKAAGGLTERLFMFAADNVRHILERYNVNFFVKSLVCDGILTAVGGVAPFFGQIFILFLCISLMEDTGYMSRVVFLSERILGKLGADAHSAVPLITGFGCSVPAILAAKNADGKEMRKKTVKLIPFVSCGAKTPVYAAFASYFFEEHKFFVIMLLYAAGIAAACVYSAADGAEARPLILEMPPYRMPVLKNTVNLVKDKLIDFTLRAGSVLFIAGIAVWFMSGFDFSLKAVSTEKSMLGYIGGFIAPIFKPCGFGTWQAAVALLSGFLAKEAILSSLAVTAGELGNVFTPASAASFLVFVLFYPPCAAAIAAVSGELSKKETACLALRHLITAWIASAAVYMLFSAKG